MKIYLHTICLEPARWLPQKVSRPLLELLPHIARHGFGELEIFEPHLTGGADLRAVARELAAHGLTPIILSSYLNLNPAVTPDETLEEKIGAVVRRVEALGFPRLRLFPGPGMRPDDAAGVAVFTERLGRLAHRLPGVEILLETHDGSLADDPARMVAIMENLPVSNVGLLYQPTVFGAEAALAQLAAQKALVRHVHLQNRRSDGSFETLEKGTVPWRRVLAELGHGVSSSVEFVPVGICPVEAFDLEATLRQARAEADYILSGI